MGILKQTELEIQKWRIMRNREEQRILEFFQHYIFFKLRNINHLVNLCKTWPKMLQNWLKQICVPKTSKVIAK